MPNDVYNDMAGRVLAHAFNDEMEKISREKSILTTDDPDRIAAVTKGGAIGTILGATLISSGVPRNVALPAASAGALATWAAMRHRQKRRGWKWKKEKTR